MSLRARISFSVAAILLAYVGGYLGARKVPLIIHRTWVSAGRVTRNEVVAADAPLMGTYYTGAAAFVFTPLRLLETAIWNVRDGL